MRKDIKFGLTIGSVLVVVLAVYIAVVNRSPENKPGDVSYVPSNNTPAPESSNDTKPATDTPAAVPPAVVTLTPTPGAGTATPGETPANPVDATVVKPSDASTAQVTMPAVGAHSDLWESALSHGVMAAPSDPERTATPSGADSGAMTAGTTNATSDSPTTRPSSALRTHRVQPGETFASIAAVVYGNSRYFSRIVAANPNVDPKKLKPGMIINIPAAPEVTSVEPAARSTSAVPADSSSTYTVKAGDTLAKICRNLYGTDQWDKLYELNKDVIGANPAKLKLNMVLKLPAADIALNLFWKIKLSS